jgi:hypothetical protein
MELPHEVIEETSLIKPLLIQVSLVDVIRLTEMYAVFNTESN